MSQHCLFLMLASISFVWVFHKNYVTSHDAVWMAGWRIRHNVKMMMTAYVVKLLHTSSSPHSAWCTRSKPYALIITPREKTTTTKRIHFFCFVLFYFPVFFLLLIFEFLFYGSPWFREEVLWLHAHKMAALMAMFSWLSNINFHKPGHISTEKLKWVYPLKKKKNPFLSIWPVVILCLGCPINTCSNIISGRICVNFESTEYKLANVQPYTRKICDANGLELACLTIHMGWTRLKFESWKVRNHTENASQSLFKNCFLRYLNPEIQL